jgi:tRNA(Arg) A34 adenosine deaminase TadA
MALGRLHFMRTLPYPRPDWIKRISGSWNTPRTAEALMRIVLDVAHAGVIKGFGPFAAALCDRSGRIIELNVNQVTAAHDCSAHGEAVVMRNSQALLSTNTKPCVDLHDYTLYTSSQPCVSCSGQIWGLSTAKGGVGVAHTRGRNPGAL